ncbi:hypothetical protein MRX96_046649 [Rhipicephalus microplus]
MDGEVRRMAGATAMAIYFSPPLTGCTYTATTALPFATPDPISPGYPRTSFAYFVLRTFAAFERRTNKQKADVCRKAH